MCELLGLSFNQPISPSLSFRGFKFRSEKDKNPDGWGIAYYPHDFSQNKSARRKAPFEKMKLEDEDFEINLAEEKSPDQQGYIIASKPLTNAFE